jgi:MYXO-CTERM domain-containing protein
MPPAPPPTTIRRAAPFALAIGLAAALAAPAAAYVRTRSPDGTFPLLWSDPRITMTLRISGTQVVPAADFIGAARRSAATWSDPALASSLAFTIDAASDAPAGTLFDQVNAVSFRTDSWNEPMYPEQALALTTVWSQDAQIVDADTEINAADPRFQWGVLPDDPAQAAMAAEVDLQNALTHELGHVIGLSHPCTLADPPSRPETDDQGAPVLSCSDPALPASVRDATMFPSSEPGSIAERTLSPDEIEAVHDLYPLRAAPGPSLGDRSGSCAVAPGSEEGGALGAAALALFFARRRRSTRCTQIP